MLTGRAGFLSEAARPVIELAALAFAVAVAGAVAVFSAFAVAVFSAFAVAVAVFSAVAGDLQTASLFGFFYVLLPLANATADWSSVSVTRWFLQAARDHRQQGLVLIGATALDLMAGLACLGLLLAGLVSLLELWALIAPPPLDWRAYWQAELADRSAGIALWLMCFTTILPTLIHTCWAVALWFFDTPAPTRTAVEERQHWDHTAPEPDQTAQAMRLATLLQRGAAVWRWRAGAVLVALAPFALWLEVWSLTRLPALLTGDAPP